MATFEEQSSPLTSAQSGLWFAHMVDPESRDYDLMFRLHISGTIDGGALRQAIRTAERECGAFGAVFNDGSGVPVQAWRDRPSTFAFVDVSDDPDTSAAMDAYLAGRWSRPFHLLGDEPLSDNVLVRRDASSYVWCRRSHHILCDGRGEMLFQERVGDLYTAIVDPSHVAGPPLGHARDLVERNLKYRSSAAILDDRDYWLEVLSTPLESTHLGRKQAEGRRPAPGTVMHRVSLGAEQHSALRSLGRGWSAVVASLAFFVASRTGSRKVGLGFPVAVRIGEMAETTPGMVANELPLAVTLVPGLTAAEAAALVLKRMAALIRHQGYPALELKREIGLAGHGDALGQCYVA